MRQSQALNIGEALGMTAIETLRGGLVRNSVERHAFIVNQCATIVALALCNQAPKGLGDPADHKRIGAVLTDAKLNRYADHAKFLPKALKDKGHRSCASWDEALTEGSAIVVALFAPCAPKVRTLAEQKAAEERKAAKAAERAADAKAAEEEATNLRAEELRAEFVKGQASALTVDSIVSAIRAGAFSADEIETIRAALPRKLAHVTDVAPKAAPLALAA